jgi:hypothetical protein
MVLPNKGKTGSAKDLKQAISSREILLLQICKVGFSIAPLKNQIFKKYFTLLS